MIAELAGVAGMDPGPYSLRELVWMVEAGRREAWNHTASLMALMANCHRGPKQKPFNAQDFHPMTPKQGSSRGTPIKYLSIADLAGSMGVSGGPKKTRAPQTAGER